MTDTRADHYLKLSSLVVCVRHFPPAAPIEMDWVSLLAESMKAGSPQMEPIGAQPCACGNGKLAVTYHYHTHEAMLQAFDPDKIVRVTQTDFKNRKDHILGQARNQNHRNLTMEEFYAYFIEPLVDDYPSQRALAKALGKSEAYISQAKNPSKYGAQAQAADRLRNLVTKSESPKEYISTPPPTSSGDVSSPPPISLTPGTSRTKPPTSMDTPPSTPILSVPILSPPLTPEQDGLARVVEASSALLGMELYLKPKAYRNAPREALGRLAAQLRGLAMKMIDVADDLEDGRFPETPTPHGHAGLFVKPEGKRDLVRVAPNGQHPEAIRVLLENSKNSVVLPLIAATDSGVRVNLDGKELFVPNARVLGKAVAVKEGR